MARSTSSCVYILACGLVSLLAAQTRAKVDFGRDIQPLFQQHCIECHRTVATDGRHAAGSTTLCDGDSRWNDDRTGKCGWEPALPASRRDEIWTAHASNRAAERAADQPYQDVDRSGSRVRGRTSSRAINLCRPAIRGPCESRKLCAPGIAKHSRDCFARTRKR